MSETKLQAAKERYQAFLDENLSLDMTRGKPAPEQLDLTNEMLTCLTAEDVKAANGTDCRNYGVLDGVPEAKAFFAEYLGVEPTEVIIGGNASLTLMYDAMARAVLFGVPGSAGPWRDEKVKWLCPSPGYDRHFNVCADLGIEMITVPMNEHGPDMDTVKQLVANDASIKGIWCVPRYSNPTGITYSDEVVDGLAQMETAAPDFRIFWDNAYHAHHLVDNPQPLKNIMDACKAAGNADRVYIFGSTSKITFAGAGVAVLAASEANLTEARRHLSMQTIGSDKLNQLRHLKFFGDVAGLHAHMRKHAAILKPKFDVVEEVLTDELADDDLATWSKPEGGYFVSLDTRPGLADKVVSMAAEAGVKLTGAGATYPLRNDPQNCNIRIAPSLPSLPEIRKAMEVVATCVKIATWS